MRVRHVRICAYKLASGLEGHQRLSYFTQKCRKGASTSSELKNGSLLLDDIVSGGKNAVVEVKQHEY